MVQEISRQNLTHCWVEWTNEHSDSNIPPTPLPSLQDIQKVFKNSKKIKIVCLTCILWKEQHVCFCFGGGGRMLNTYAHTMQTIIMSSEQLDETHTHIIQRFWCMVLTVCCGGGVFGEKTTTKPCSVWVIFRQRLCCFSLGFNVNTTILPKEHNGVFPPVGEGLAEK